MINKDDIARSLMSLQDEICQGLESLDAQGKFVEDNWEREGGGGGRTRVIQGDLIAKGGVNFSSVHGELSENVRKALELPFPEFYATGVSIVLHSNNPFVPIIHMNVRYFESGDVYWFGGGIDLTPHYIFPEDARYFHTQLKKVCDKYDKTFYPNFKVIADDYFYIKHREETRGIGGIFFDKLAENHSKVELHNFILDVGRSFVPIYAQIANRRRETPYNEHNLNWQKLRRGRYVEFNLVWDRGTKFGLETGGRTESILMSLPPEATWEYNQDPEIGSQEAGTLGLLKKGIDWVNYTSG